MSMVLILELSLLIMTQDLKKAIAIKDQLVNVMNLLKLEKECLFASIFLKTLLKIEGIQSKVIIGYQLFPDHIVKVATTHAWVEILSGKKLDPAKENMLAMNKDRIYFYLQGQDPLSMLYKECTGGECDRLPVASCLDLNIVKVKKLPPDYLLADSQTFDSFHKILNASENRPDFFDDYLNNYGIVRTQLWDCAKWITYNRRFQLLIDRIVSSCFRPQDKNNQIEIIRFDHELELLAKQLNAQSKNNSTQTSNPQYDMNRLMQMTGYGENIPVRHIYPSAQKKVSNPMATA
jgi:hypothetical protein